MRDTAEKLSPVTIALHWLIAVGVITLLAVGSYMAQNEIDSLIPLHKSMGMLFFVLIVARVLWRWKNGLPLPVASQAKVLEVIARATHVLLLLLTVVMPLSGITMSVAGGYGLAIFSWQILAATPDLAHPGEMLALNPAMTNVAHDTHEICGYLLMALIALHILGAFKHHWLDKDRTLRRMLGK